MTVKRYMNLFHGHFYFQISSFARAVILVSTTFGLFDYCDIVIDHSEIFVDYRFEDNNLKIKQIKRLNSIQRIRAFNVSNSKEIRMIVSEKSILIGKNTMLFEIGKLERVEEQLISENAHTRELFWYVISDFPN